MLSEAAISAGAARELNPLVLAIGTPAKIILVATCSALLLWRRPRALVWPALAFLALAAYHLTGLLGALSIG
jgi:predicted signal transduction protein with EAL and GGDEF domain